jgi:hypothetical protein
VGNRGGGGGVIVFFKSHKMVYVPFDSMFYFCFLRTHNTCLPNTATEASLICRQISINACPFARL